MRHRSYLLFPLLATLLLWKVWFGFTYLPGDILWSFPLWYDGVHQTQNWDLFDVILLFYPDYQIYNELLGAGQMFLWDPYSLMGHPVYNNAWTGFFYPVRLALNLVFSPERAHDVYLWIHLAAAGVTGRWFFRGLGLSGTASSLGAVAWMLNGFNMGWFEHEHAITFAALMPWAMGLLQRGAEKKRPALFAGGAFLLGLAGLSGVLNFWAHALGFAAAWGFFVAWRNKALPAMLLVCGLSIGGAALHVLPAFELAAVCERPVISLEYQNSIQREMLAGFFPTLLVPDLFGNPNAGMALTRVRRGGYWIYPETCAYVGVLTILLLPASLAFRRRPEWKFFAVALGLLLFLPATPLYAIPWKLLPGYDRMACTRLLFLVPFCLAALAAYGAEAVLQKPQRARPLVMAAILFALGWTLVLSYLQGSLDVSTLVQGRWFRLPDPEVTGAAYPQACEQAARQFYRWANPAMAAPLVLLLASAAVLGARPRAMPALLAADLLFYALRFNTAVPLEQLYPMVPEIAFLQRQPRPFRVLSLATIKPNTLTPFRLMDVGGMDSLYPKQTAAFLNALQNGHTRSPEAPFINQAFPIRNSNSPLIDLAGARYVVTYPGVRLPEPRYRLVFTHQLWIYENTQALPLAWRVKGATSVASFQEALDKVAAVGVDYRRQLFVTGTAQWPGSGAGAGVHVTYLAPGVARILLEPSQEPGYLVYTENLYPGWRAWVDGVEVELLAADGPFMAVPVTAGARQVVLRFQPAVLRTGAVVTLLSWLIVLGWGWASSHRGSGG